MPVRILTGLKAVIEGVAWTRLVTAIAGPDTVETAPPAAGWKVCITLSVTVVGRCRRLDNVVVDKNDDNGYVTLTSKRALDPELEEETLLATGGAMVPPVVVGQGTLLEIDTWTSLQAFCWYRKIPADTYLSQLTYLFSEDEDSPIPAIQRVYGCLPVVSYGGHESEMQQLICSKYD